MLWAGAKANTKGSAVGMVAGFFAPAATSASAFVTEDLRGHLLPFGILTPYATKRASLQKDGEANAVSVVKPQLLDVKYSTLYHTANS
jgi:hypothetical protein